jgi:cell wall-associated NlpC family hydrolase
LLIKYLRTLEGGMVMPVQQWIKVRLRRLVPMVAALGLLLGGAVTVSFVTATAASADSASEITGAVNWAIKEMQTNPNSYDGLCLQFVADAYSNGGGVSIGSADTAYDYWNNHSSAQVTDGSTPPEGALVFWGPDPWTTAGHVALSLGGGTVISSAERSYTDLHEFTIAARNSDGYAQYYLGWMMPPGISAPSGGGSTPTATAAGYL